MNRYMVFALAALVAGCAPKSNPDESWKADCVKNFSQSPTDYMLCMQRKAEAEKKGAATQNAKNDSKQNAENDSNDVHTSKIGHKMHFEGDLNDQTLEEDSGASEIL